MTENSNSLINMLNIMMPDTCDSTKAALHIDEIKLPIPLYLSISKFLKQIKSISQHSRP